MIPRSRSRSWSARPACCARSSTVCPRARPRPAKAPGAGARRTRLDGLPPGGAGAREGPGRWSPYDVVGHLIHGERTDWIPRAEIILDQGQNRRFTPYDRFAQFRESQGKSLINLLDEFEALRRANLETLSGWHVTDTQLALQE